MITETKRVSFIVVNCNRLFYLKSCVESLLLTTADYHNKEIIVIDNASVEKGTESYLDSLELRNHRVIKHQTRNQANEFAHALNVGISLATGDIIIPIQGDTQFVVMNWLNAYVSLLSSNLIDSIGCVMLDAQRRIRNFASKPFIPIKQHPFLFDKKRNPINCAADCVYTRDVLNKIGKWRTDNASHEGGNDSETEMLVRVSHLMKSEGLTWTCVLPLVPPSVGIFTDIRGTMARCRGNKRFGDYWSPRDNTGNFYYEILDHDTIESMIIDSSVPLSLEEIAKPIGFMNPLDQNGNWLKNPIRPETALPSDFIVLYDEEKNDKKVSTVNDDALNDWMSS